MTALWGSLIVLGVVMIGVAVWPSIRARTGGKAAATADQKDPEGF